MVTIDARGLSNSITLGRKIFNFLDILDMFWTSQLWKNWMGANWFVLTVIVKSMLIWFWIMEDWDRAEAA